MIKILVRFALPLLTLAVTLAARDKPNIILIMADDIGVEWFDCYGSKEHQTPVIDHLAEEGMRFTYAYSQPLCTPSRVQLMTGRYNNRNYKTFGFLDDEEVTFANLLKQAGYATAIAGKWQLNSIRRQAPGTDGKERPYHFGFDEYCLWQLTGRGERYAAPLLVQNGETKQYANDDYGPDIFSGFLIDFMKRHKDEPFFLYYPMALVHAPFAPTPDSESWNDEPDQRVQKKGFGAPQNFPDMVAYMDKIVGQMVKEVEALGLAEDTVIIFTGDNGTHPRISAKMQDGSQFRGGKGRLSDDGTHVPLVVYWPGTTQPGVVTNRLVDFTDFLPTLCDLAGIPVPQDRVIDGVSLTPLVQGKDNGSDRDWVYFWFLDKEDEKTAEAKVCARNHDWKLYEDGSFYHVSKDPLEKEPLTGDLDAEAQANHDALSKVLESMKES